MFCALRVITMRNNAAPSRPQTTPAVEKSQPLFQTGADLYDTAMEPSPSNNSSLKPTQTFSPGREFYQGRIDVEDIQPDSDNDSQYMDDDCVPDSARAEMTLRTFSWSALNEGRYETAPAGQINSPVVMPGPRSRSAVKRPTKPLHQLGLELLCGPVFIPPKHGDI